MGSYSHLAIGDIVFSWKYHVPTFLTFLFEEDDLFFEEEAYTPDPGDEDPYVPEPGELMIEQAGFRTSVAKARRVLDDYGYTLPFFADIYESFSEDLRAWTRELIDDEIGRQHNDQLSDEERARIVDAHIQETPDTALGDLEAFTTFLRQAIETDLKMEPFLDDYVFDRGPGEDPLRVPVMEHTRYRRTQLADFETLQMLTLGRAHRVPANVLRPLCLFEDSYVFNYPEVISLLYTRVVLDAMPEDAVVELDIREVVETEEEVRSMHSTLARELLHKVDVYERVFRALSSREEDVQDRYARAQVRNALTSLSSATDSQGKGEALESLMAAAFALKPQLQVVQRTYSTGDEEIDLVVKNNVARPFWHGLGSPLLFIECKNWADPVGAPEVRNFEGKLQNHAPMTRVGILVAPGGFTREAVTAIKRSSRDPYTLALVDGDDLAHLANGAESVLDWLERLLCRPI